MNIYACKNWIVISGDNIRRGYDRVKGSIGRSYDEVEGVTVSVSRNFNVLSERYWQGGKKIGLFEYRRGRRHEY